LAEGIIFVSQLITRIDIIISILLLYMQRYTVSECFPFSLLNKLNCWQSLVYWQ